MDKQALDYATARPGSRPSRRYQRTLWLGVALMALLVSFLLPSILRVSRSSSGLHDPQRQRVGCVRNLKTVGAALNEYAAEHGGEYPESLSALVLSGVDLYPGNLMCPSSSDSINLARSTEQLARALSENRHPSYLYLGAGRRSCDPGSTWLMCDAHAEHSGQANVLYLDGTVHAVSADAVKRGMAQARDRLAPTGQPRE